MVKEVRCNLEIVERSEATGYVILDRSVQQVVRIIHARHRSKSIPASGTKSTRGGLGSTLRCGDRWGHIGATSGPRTTGSQRTITVIAGLSSAQLSAQAEAGVAGQRGPPWLSDTEAVEGSEPPGGTASAVAGHDTAAASPAGNHTRFVPNAYDRFGILQRGACLQREKRPHRRLEGRGR
jgi:hypothetical protein